MTGIAGATKPSPARSLLRAILDRRLGVREPAPTARPSAVARQLGRLGSGWSVLDDVVAGHRGRIDHVVIGPGGVFVIAAQHDARETICLGGDMLLVDGRRVHHVRDSREDAADVSARLTDAVGFPVPVTALVMIVGDRRFVVPSQPDDSVVRVATPGGGLRWMRRHSVEWTEYGVDRIRAAARAPATWAPRNELRAVSTPQSAPSDAVQARAAS
jgi:hypothetical protein